MHGKEKGNTVLTDAQQTESWVRADKNETEEGRLLTHDSLILTSGFFQIP